MERASRYEAEWRRKKKVLTDGLTPGDARGKLRWRRAGKPPFPLLASEFVLFMAPHGLSTASAYTVLLSIAEKLLRINKSWPMLDMTQEGQATGLGTTYLLRAHPRAQDIEM